MTSSNWRIEQNALDFLGNQRKKLQIADRRPLQRRSDLVGPGIAAQCNRVEDCNELTASYNGYYSVAAGLFNNAPNSTDDFIVTTASDAELGGVQTAVSLADGSRFQRVFNRPPTAPGHLIWQGWSAL